MAFQQSKGLNADGVIGVETWKALEAQPLASVVDKSPVGPQEMLADIAAQYVGAASGLSPKLAHDTNRSPEIFLADNPYHAHRANKDRRAPPPGPEGAHPGA
jgi:peptidoglycan hydrolase-like protein with peptidoglycan-binding domain